MDILYNYKPYSLHKKGIFSITTDEYKLPFGWICKEEEILIIGETEDCYVYKLVPGNHGEWVGDIVIQKEYILPLGIHKTRLIEWKDTQLQLFN